MRLLAGSTGSRIIAGGLLGTSVGMKIPVGRNGCTDGEAGWAVGGGAGRGAARGARIGIGENIALGSVSVWTNENRTAAPSASVCPAVEAANAQGLRSCRLGSIKACSNILDTLPFLGREDIRPDLLT